MFHRMFHPPRIRRGAAARFAYQAPKCGARRGGGAFFNKKKKEAVCLLNRNRNSIINRDKKRNIYGVGKYM
jgi:hypothetical protein